MNKLLILLLFFTGMVKAQIVTIPNANFKAKLLSADVTNPIAYAGGGYIKIDANNDGEIQETEAQVVDSLNVENSNITDLIGVAGFSNLKKLNCNSNPIASLDVVNSLTNLEILVCYSNNLTSLNVDALPNLKILDCSHNQISSLNFTALNNLIRVQVEFNELTFLNVNNLTNLMELYCNNNQLTSLDVTGATNLMALYCSHNQLINLNVTGLSSLVRLVSSYNNISSLNLTDLSSLNYVECFFNTMTSINVSNLPNLETLYCGYNQLANFNLTNLPSLFYLDFRSNAFTAIDVSGLSTLKRFYCSDNAITSLDVSNMHNLLQLECANNQLTTLMIKNGKDEYLVLNGNPNLQFICADETQVIEVQSLAGSAVVNSYCSFTPGGNYNTITGTIKYDANNDGCDVSDIIFPNTRVNIDDGTTTGASFSNESGNYIFYTPSGSFEITPAFENAAWFTFSPPTSTIPFSNSDNNFATQDFCITANGLHPDLEIIIAPITPARPGFDAKYQIVYKNKGNQILSGNITFTYNDSVLDFVDATVNPDTQNIGLLNWNFSNLKPFENRSFYIVLNVNSPIETPPANIDDVLHYEATITPVIGDEVSSDNLFAFDQSVVGSFDPNDITCIEGTVVPSSEIGNYLHYVINFENTGTFAAENIVVKTMVDTSKFDMDSVQLLNTSNSVDARINDNKVEFIFKNINLDIGGHGHILLKIRTKESLVTGDAVAKRADIFFDYNAPIDTGLANTIFQTLSNPTFDTDESVSVSPNPASNEVDVKSDNTIKSIQLYDIQGRIIMTSLVNDLESKLDISSYTKGIYFIKVTTEKGIKVQKLLKQ